MIIEFLFMNIINIVNIIIMKIMSKIIEFEIIIIYVIIRKIKLIFKILI